METAEAVSALSLLSLGFSLGVISIVLKVYLAPSNGLILICSSYKCWNYPKPSWMFASLCCLPCKYQLPVNYSCAVNFIFWFLASCCFQLTRDCTNCNTAQTGPSLTYCSMLQRNLPIRHLQINSFTNEFINPFFWFFSTVGLPVRSLHCSMKHTVFLWSQSKSFMDSIHSRQLPECCIASVS